MVAGSFDPGRRRRQAGEDGARDRRESQEGQQHAQGQQLALTAGTDLVGGTEQPGFHEQGHRDEHAAAGQHGREDRPGTRQVRQAGGGRGRHDRHRQRLDGHATRIEVGQVVEGAERGRAGDDELADPEGRALQERRHPGQDASRTARFAVR